MITNSSSNESSSSWREYTESCPPSDDDDGDCPLIAQKQHSPQAVEALESNLLLNIVNKIKDRNRSNEAILEDMNSLCNLKCLNDEECREVKTWLERTKETLKNTHPIEILKRTECYLINENDLNEDSYRKTTIGRVCSIVYRNVVCEHLFNTCFRKIILNGINEFIY